MSFDSNLERTGLYSDRALLISLMRHQRPRFKWLVWLLNPARYDAWKRAVERFPEIDYP